MTTFTPRGWKPGLVEKRFANTMPTSYSADDRTVDCVISRGSPVQRFYGTETLRISRDAVIIDRLISTGIPLLDSHQQVGINNALGKVTRIWFDNGALMGKIAFNATAQGRLAEGMVARGELCGISAGYKVEEWKISDQDGNIIDPEKVDLRWDDSGLKFEATRWELLEISAVMVAADASASIRSLGGKHEIGTAEIAERMLIRTRMFARHAMHDRQQAALLDRTFQ